MRWRWRECVVEEETTGGDQHEVEVEAAAGWRGRLRLTAGGSAGDRATMAAGPAAEVREPPAPATHLG